MGTRDSCSNPGQLVQQSGLILGPGGYWEEVGVDVKESKIMMGNVVSQLVKERKGLKSGPTNDPKVHLGPTPSYPLMAFNLKTQAKAKLNQASSG